MAKHGVKAAKIAKPYGLRGELQLILHPNTTEYFKEGTFLFIEMDGQKVPFFMEEVDLVATDLAIVKLEFIDDKEAASMVTGSDIYFDPRLRIRETKGTAGLLTLTGYLVIDEKMGEMGTVKTVLAQASNPLWLIQGKGEEILVPATDDFVKQIDHKNQQIHLQLPEGFADI